MTATNYMRPMSYHVQWLESVKQDSAKAPLSDKKPVPTKLTAFSRRVQQARKQKEKLKAQEAVQSAAEALELRQQACDKLEEEPRSLSSVRADVQVVEASSLEKLEFEEVKLATRFHKLEGVVNTEKLASILAQMLKTQPGDTTAEPAEKQQTTALPQPQLQQPLTLTTYQHLVHVSGLLEWLVLDNGVQADAVFVQEHGLGAGDKPRKIMRQVTKWIHPLVGSMVERPAGQQSDRLSYQYLHAPRALAKYGMRKLPTSAVPEWRRRKNTMTRLVSQQVRPFLVTRPEWIYCAGQWQECKCRGKVRWGVGEKWMEIEPKPGEADVSVTCSIAKLPDVAPGEDGKRCECLGQLVVPGLPTEAGGLHDGLPLASHADQRKAVCERSVGL
ncbi:unnamed protein product [Prorocentrum cordatum]|uniref:Uncharacterized protein n=1 Tax=Prorocentrum cordatum TaxID=2364126 RepID=A0ABN9SC36_9DINO|nr:unnamed protein product [Polarella glacialis]